MGNLVYVMSELADFSEILPILIFILFRRIKEYPFLFAGLTIQSILYIYTWYTAKNSIYNLDIYHLIGIVELVYVYLFYHFLIPLPKVLKNLFFFILTIYILNSIFFEPFYEHINPYGRSLSCLFLLILSIYYLYYIYLDESIQHISQSTPFWINAGFIIYFATSFFTFLFSRKILTIGVEPTSFFGTMWSMHTFADVVRSIIIAFALAFTKKNNKG